MAERHERKIQRQRRASKLPWEKTLTALDRSRLPRSADRQLTALLEGTFLDRAENVLAFGNPGSGKTTWSVLWARSLILLGRRVLFSTCALLVQRLLRAKIDLTLEKELKKLDRFEALIVDDIGYVQQSREEMEVLFTTAGPSLRTSQHLADQQPDLLGLGEDLQGPPDDGAAIDRLVHHSVILELNVPSYRMEERQGKAAGNHEMRKPRGGQIRKSADWDPGKCLVRAIDECPPRERSYSALQRPLSSLVDLVHSPRRQRERGGAPFGLRPHSVPLAF